ncbi:sensor domain-containing protein [Desulforamulus hydrothermalis]|uniref:Diguanylate cyclase/phosphodiesterase with PAS/PAC sensor(S) n=1 Tax=Desulforamulus hydrothermalis Lam5 = DSM 18033 TaxID=1121428 RepID=K8EG02_9FIRM|nr:EAL domain-containing protein [Desulforamulus hydrothermalis]CCO07621.1 Diguanylate cyclase/phosphodiesterase with PAS/PAC sensor(S) [Desulforamulus hydrothermalis Lam5 = DSM 18033]SHH19717.1 PAS domain S-box-containing protein/diguanylate cyclase (GGDEF) domain-containing protein [Desulforamulus hydrothermalis Lam5 = DSM 18033]
MQQHLKDSERFRALLDQVSEAILVLEAPHWRFVDVNQAACTLLELEMSAFYEKTAPQLPGLACLPVWQEACVAWERGEPYVQRFIHYFNPSEGSQASDPRVLEIEARLLRFQENSYLVAIARDISERHAMEQELCAVNEELEETIAELTAAEEELRQNYVLMQERERQLAEWERRFRNLLENIQLLAVLLDQQGKIVFINDFFLNLTGWRRQEVLGQDYFKLFILPAERQLMSGRFCQCIKEGCIETNFKNSILTRRGEQRLIYWNNTILYDEQGRAIGTASIGEDITERQRFEEKVKFLAYHDAMTGLPNRLSLTEQLAREIKRAEQLGSCLAVLFLDLDRFKLTNDTLGHTAGDELLKQVGERLLGLLNRQGMLTRLGGDEFIIILPDLTVPQQAVEYAEALLQTFQRPFNVMGSQLHVTCSIGIALFPDDGKDVQTLLKNADLAMYRAKAQGRNSYRLYTPELQETVQRQLELEEALRQGLAGREFTLFYQPVLDRQGREVYREALLRWQRPGGICISPAEFIPVAEETGLILPLDDWVLQAACRQAANWDVQVAVNMSGLQFAQPNLVDKVASVLRETGLPPGRLIIEITENTAMRNLQQTIKHINGLRRLGVEVALDDFGTGYSSLSYLKNFAVNIIKIDRSFVADLLNNQVSAAIVRAVLLMAESLSVAVVAEGVETRQQLTALQDMGCRHFQGYLLGRPQPPNR